MTNAGAALCGLPAIGVRLQNLMNRVQAETAESPVKSVLLGIALAVTAVAGGLIASLVIWAVLVGFFA
jgi:multisubunit Na+/H+ antiporter MnhG subunit